MAVTSPDLWSITPGGGPIDPQRLAAAVEVQVARDDLDFRSRLLIRDSVDSLRTAWGPERVDRWLAGSANGERIRQICLQDLGAPGFPSLRQRLMEPTRPETLEQFLRELGSHLHAPVRIRIGGSASLILVHRLSRATDDVDVVDEVPEELRAQHDLLDGLASRYGLRLAHFQSHFLPIGWEGRARSLGRFGNLDVEVVDVYDVFLSKLFSRRPKDRDDLRFLKPSIDVPTLVQRLRETTGSLRGEVDLRGAAEANWYILFGDKFPA